MQVLPSASRLILLFMIAEKEILFKMNFLIVMICFCVLKLLERALRALASSSGGAACPGGRGVGVRGQPRGSGGDSKLNYSKKKIL